MAENRSYIIPIHGLSLGFHEFSFDIKKDFLRAFEGTDILDLDLVLKLKIDKKETLYHFFFDFSGTINIDCDRCGDPMNQKIDSHFEMMVKHSQEIGSYEEGEIEMKYISLEDNQIDLLEDIFDYINLSLPMRKTCGQKSCDDLIESMMYQEEETEDSSEEAIDPRWAALKNLKVKD